MIYGRQTIISSFTIICETDTFILIADNDDPEFGSVTNAADYTIESLAKKYDLSNRRVIYRDSMQRFDELCHEQDKFTGFKALTQSQQNFFGELMADHESAKGGTNAQRDN